MSYPSVTYSFSDGTSNTIYAAQVNQNFTDIITGLSAGTKDNYSYNSTVANNLTVNGNTVLGNASTDSVTVTGSTVTFSSATARLTIPQLAVTASAQTIASDTITPTTSNVVVTSETGTTDDLSFIAATGLGSVNGTILIISAANGHTITVRNNQGGNDPILCGSDRVLSSDQDKIMLVRISAKWNLLSFADNA